VETIMNNKNHIREEQLIDFVLENTSKELQQEIQQHINQCNSCAKQLMVWSHLLNQPNSTKPSAELKNKVWESVRHQRPLNRKRKKGWAVAISSVAAIFLLFIGMLDYYQSNVESYEVARNNEITVNTIQSEPQTQQMAIIPVADYRDITGNVWINDVTQEMLLEVEGLANISNRDHQLWIIYENNEIKGEILPTMDGSSRVLIKGKGVNKFKVIKASIEPLGGSREPTGPETFVVPIKNN